MHDPEVPGYVYVATATELMAKDITKIGFTRDIRTRSINHRNSSSSPYKLFCFQCFRFEKLEDARRVETEVKREMRKAKLQYSGKAEFFRVCPSTMCDAVRETIDRLRLDAIEEFPSDLDGVLEKAGDFVSLPRELLGCLSPDEAKSYSRGARDLLWVLWHLDGLVIRREDISSLLDKFDFNSTYSEQCVGSVVANYYRNHGIKKNRKLGTGLSEEISKRERNGFSRFPGDWEVPNWRAIHAWKQSRESHSTG